MKTSFSVLAAAAVLAVAASEETCDYSVVKPTFHELGTPMAACENATGITFETESTLSLSSTQQSDICSECEDMVDLVYSFTWYDCEMEIDGVNQTVSSYYETLVGSCTNSSSGSSATSSGSSTTTTTSSAETTLLSTAALIASSVLFAAAL